MKKILVIVMALIFLVPFAVFSQDAPQAPLTFKIDGAKKPAVTFDHTKHQMDCHQCHHTKDFKQCTECHKLKTEAKVPSIKKASHKNCKNCHKKMKKGPRKCKQCHK